MLTEMQIMMPSSNKGGFMKTGFVIAAMALAPSGCASIFSGTTQEVGIRTTPGAKFTVTNA